MTGQGEVSVKSCILWPGCGHVERRGMNSLQFENWTKIRDAHSWEGKFASLPAKVVRRALPYVRHSDMSRYFSVSCHCIGWRLVLTYRGWKAPEMQGLHYLKVTLARCTTRLTLSQLCLVNYLNMVVPRQILGPLMEVRETLKAKAATCSLISELNLWTCAKTRVGSHCLKPKLRVSCSNVPSLLVPKKCSLALSPGRFHYLTFIFQV